VTVVTVSCNITRALVTIYNINCVHARNSYIKSAVWSSFAERS